MCSFSRPLYKICYGSIRFELHHPTIGTVFEDGLLAWPAFLLQWGHLFHDA